MPNASSVTPARRPTAARAARIAALVLGIAQSLLQLPLGPTWAQTVFYVALFATLMFRPQGFFGGRLAQRF